MMLIGIGSSSAEIASAALLVGVRVFEVGLVQQQYSGLLNLPSFLPVDKIIGRRSASL